jgi:hypothetical protein
MNLAFVLSGFAWIHFANNPRHECKPTYISKIRYNGRQMSSEIIWLLSFYLSNLVVPPGPSKQILLISFKLRLIFFGLFQTKGFVVLLYKKFL